MRFLIYGAGAMGSLFGAALSESHDVTLVGRRPHVEAIRARGLVVRGKTDVVARPRAIEDVQEVEDAPDVVILTVKSYDTAAAAAELAPFNGVSTFLSLQNGLGNAELLAEKLDRVLAGITYNGVTFVGPGEILHAGVGVTTLGPWKGTDRANAMEVATAFEACGLRTMVTVAGLGIALWSKAVLNACFNPMTGLLGLKSGSLIRSEELMRCVDRIIDESVAVAHAVGVELKREEILSKVRAVSTATADNRSSMLQDLARGGRTEIDFMNGRIATLGREHGISCPVNEMLTLLVKSVEGTEWRPPAARVQ